MYTVKEETTFVGVSELRTKMDEILERAKHGLVIIEKRRKPQAMLISPEEYEYLTDMLDITEDFVLGHIAQERLKNSAKSDFVDIESLL